MATKNDPYYGDRMGWGKEDGYAGLPEFCYLHTMDQLKVMLGTTPEFLKSSTYRIGVDDPRRIQYPDQARKLLKLINIGTDESPEWRCNHIELKRWMKVCRVPAYQF